MSGCDFKGKARALTAEDTRVVVENIDPTPAERQGPIVIECTAVTLKAQARLSAKTLARQQRAEAIKNVGVIGPVDSGRTTQGPTSIMEKEKTASSPVGRTVGILFSVDDGKKTPALDLLSKILEDFEVKTGQLQGKMQHRKK